MFMQVLVLMSLFFTSDEKLVEIEKIEFIEKSIILTSEISDAELEARDDVAMIGVFDGVGNFFGSGRLHIIQHTEFSPRVTLLLSGMTSANDRETGLTLTLTTAQTKTLALGEILILDGTNSLSIYPSISSKYASVRALRLVMQDNGFFELRIAVCVDDSCLENKSDYKKHYCQFLS